MTKHTSAQDLELVSALISMRTGSYQKPLSPTRIDDDTATTSHPTRNLHNPKPQWCSSQPVSHARPAPFYIPMLQPHQLQFLPSTSRTQRPVQLAPLLRPHPQPVCAVAAPAGLRYSPDQRRVALMRFKAKKARRRGQVGVIRYQVRKRLADTRPRFRGRFFKPKVGEDRNKDDASLRSGDAADGY